MILFDVLLIDTRVLNLSLEVFAILVFDGLIDCFKGSVGFGDLLDYFQFFQQFQPFSLLRIEVSFQSITQIQKLSE